MTILGIDLGTTNSLGAIFLNDKAILIPNVHGEFMTPSAIAINEQDEIIVGKAALEYSMTNKFQCIKSFKRYMGSNKVFQLGANQYNTEELSAIILKNLKQDAELYLKQPIERAIISVPAYFNNKQRQATKNAAEIAGLKVERLINEPTAAALAYGIASKEDETKYLIFDLGGGTFDVTVMELFNGVLEVRASAGDSFLGGDDFTDYIVHDFCKHVDLDFQSLDRTTQAKIWQQAENCKLKLNASKNSDQTFEISTQFKNNTLIKNYSADELEMIFQPLIDRIIQPIKRSLNDSKLKTAELDAIVFVGGASKAPMLAKICTKMFMKLPFTFHDPQHVVALGVATMAGMLENNTSLSEFVLTDVCPFTLGIDCLAGAPGTDPQLEYAPIIDRNVTLPTSKVRTFYTHDNWQKSLNISVYQGEHRKLENNIKIAELEIKIDNPTKHQQQLDVRFTYDISGVLEVEVHLPESGTKQRVLIKESCGNMSESDIAAAIEKLAELKTHPRYKDVNIALLARAERMYEEHVGQMRNEISAQIREFLKCLDRQNDHAIEKARHELENFVKFCEELYE